MSNPKPTYQETMFPQAWGAPLLPWSSSPSLSTLGPVHLPSRPAHRSSTPTGEGPDSSQLHWQEGQPGAGQDVHAAASPGAALSW